MNPSRSVVVFSGGLDSTTLLYHLADLGHTVNALTIDYGQRHRREIEAAAAVCRNAGIHHTIVRLPGLADLFTANALTSAEIDIPRGTYNENTIGDTTVPNRNMIFLSIALGWAAELEFDSVAFGAHQSLTANYADCRPEFAAAMDAAARVCHDRPLRVLSPFVQWHKSRIVERGRQLSVPFELTWSCYAGGDVHCGECATCRDRRNAFAEAGISDPVPYAEQR